MPTIRFSLLVLALLGLVVATPSCSKEEKEEAKKTAEDLKDKMKDSLKDATDAAKEGASKATDATKDAAKDMKEGAGDMLENAKAKAKEMFGANKDEMMKNLKAKLGNVDQLIADLKKKADGAGLLDKAKYEGMLQGINSQRANLDDQFEGLESADESKFASLSSQLMQALDGLMQSIQMANK